MTPVTILLLTTFWGMTIATENTYKLFSGLHFQHVPDLIAYESTIPILINTNIGWKPNVTTFEETLKHMTTIYNDTYNLNELTQNLRLLQDLLHNEITDDFKDNLKLNNYQATRQARGLISQFFTWCCDLADVGQIHKLYDNEKSLKEHTNQIIDSVNTQYKDFVKTTDSLNNLTSNTQFMNEKIHNTFRAMRDNLMDVKMVNTATALEHIFTITYQTWSYILANYHKDNVHNILEKCHRNTLSEKVMNLEHLHSELTILQEKANKLDLKLAISIDKLQLYYTAKITTCKIFNDTLVTRMDIPLISKEFKGSFYKPIETPVVYQDHICTIDMPYKYVFTNVKFTKTILETETTCDQNTFPLCKLNRFSGNDNVLRCLHYVLNKGSMKDIQNTCKYSCENRTRNPIVTQLLPNRFLVTDTDEYLIVECSNGNDTHVPQLQMGTHVIDLPCDCKLKHRELTLVTDIKPCDARDIDSPIINNLIPISWSKIKTLKLFALHSGIHHEFDNLTELIDNDWQIKYPTFHLTTQKRIENVTLKQDEFDLLNYNELIIYILIAWQTMLTILVIILTYCLHITSIKLKMTLPKRDYHQQQQD